MKKIFILIILVIILIILSFYVYSIYMNKEIQLDAVENK